MTTTIKGRNGNVSGTPVCVAVAEAISEKTGKDITDFSLYDSIDTDALNTLLKGSQSKSGKMSIVIYAMDLKVVVERIDGEITISVKE